MSGRHPTADRLIAAGMRLFAERGVDATPIVKIEEAAGLAPGSGAFYKHFRSKSDVLDAALQDATRNTEVGAELFDNLDALDLRDQARFVARGTWLTFDAHRDLFLVMSREPHYRPSGFGDDPAAWPGAGPAFVARWLARLDARGQAVVRDPEATALVLLDALTSYWHQQQTQSDAPYGVDPDRFLDAWVDLVPGVRRSIRGRARR